MLKEIEQSEAYPEGRIKINKKSGQTEIQLINKIDNAYGITLKEKTPIIGPEQLTLLGWEFIGEDDELFEYWKQEDKLVKLERKIDDKYTAEEVALEVKNIYNYEDIR